MRGGIEAENCVARMFVSQYCESGSRAGAIKAGDLIWEVHSAIWSRRWKRLRHEKDVKQI